MSAAADLFERVRNRDFSPLSVATPIDEWTLVELAGLIRSHRDLYPPLLLATAAMPRYVRSGYDWNLGFLVRCLDPDVLAEVIEAHGDALLASEGLAWGLGELGSDDERLVSFLFSVCERCVDYRAWWCAGIALEKLRIADSVDVLKRTLKGSAWDALDYCFAHLAERPARIAILRLSRFDNTRSVIVPRCVGALGSSDADTVENAVWLLERLHVGDQDVLTQLLALLDRAEDVSYSLRPRVIEALGEIATEQCRPVLEQALASGRYYRVRAYAAKGLGEIGNVESLEVLQRAFDKESEPAVVPYISDAIYTIKDPAKRRLAELKRNAGWPENGMISDQSNKWYGNPDIYDRFSRAEDPENVAFSFALGLIPREARQVVDLGTGTGRFVRLIAERRPEIRLIAALDLSQEMTQFLSRMIRSGERRGSEAAIHPMRADLGSLPVRASWADCVVSSWGFPSAMWDRQRCLRELEEVARILRPMGALITVGWDETFRDELSELWYRFVPEPDFRRESLEDWRRRRRVKIASPRNCYLTFRKTTIRVPLRFSSVEEAATVLGHLFGYSAGEWILHVGRNEFSISVGVTVDFREDLIDAAEKLRRETIPGRGVLIGHGPS